MSIKTIQICIPECEQLPDIVSLFTPEENYMMIKIGSDCLREGRKVVSTLTQKEIYNKLKAETKKDVEKLELDLLVQKRMEEQKEEQIKKFYEIQLNKMKKEILDLQNEIINFKSDNFLLVKQEVEKEKERGKIMLDEKEKLIKSLTEISERLAKQNETKSSRELGDEGENAFEQLSVTFRDFQGYRIENKSQIGHKGDYHLFFKEFNVLVDAKNYTDSVQKKELGKIESDLINNNTMDFGWLISLKTNFSCWNKYPIMYKWILTETGTKCIIIINNLLSYPNPEDVLRNVWAITNEFNSLLKKTEVEDEDIRLMKERNYNLSQQIKSTQKKVTDMKRCITSMSQTAREIETDLLNSLSLLTNEVIKEEYSKYDNIKEWWYKNIEYDETNKEQILLSTDVWNKFKKENKNYINENNIVVDDIKKFIKTYIENDKYNEKSKKGAIELLGFKFVSIEENIEEKEIKNNIEIEIKEQQNKVKNKKTKVPKIDDIEINKPKRKVNPKYDEPIITDEIEENVLYEYNEKEKNVLDISKSNNILTSQVISILVNNKIIASRSLARGYKLYTETEEYKNKVIEKSNKA
jgi:hypothetical protein